MKNKLVYIGFGFHHHLGGHAGYHQIKKYLKYDYYVDAQSFFDRLKPSKWRIIDSIKHYLYPIFCFGFGAFPWFLIKCMWMAVTKGNLTFHFIYGENLYRDFKLLKVRGCKTVLTLHQPYEWFRNNPEWIKRLKSVDHIILVGETEVHLFKQLTGKDNVTFVPHGICSDFYCSDFSVKKEKMVLTVGNWLRDFEFADKVYQRILSEDKDVRIVIVSNQKNKALITSDDRIQFLSGISDEELRNLYRKTSCLFLPLIRYTANNALLEAGAVGCPILIASDHPDNSYIPESMVRILPMSQDLVVPEIVRMMDNIRDDNDLEKYVDQNFSWTFIANRTKELLYDL